MRQVRKNEPENFCTSLKKGSENRSSRFEPKILWISFSRGSGPPLKNSPVTGVSFSIKLEHKKSLKLMELDTAFLGLLQHYLKTFLNFENSSRFENLFKAKALQKQSCGRRKLFDQIRTQDFEIDWGRVLVDTSFHKKVERRSNVCHHSTCF